MENKTLLLLSYGELKEMLDDFQIDGYNSDGQSCALYLDPESEIKDRINEGVINVVHNCVHLEGKTVRTHGHWIDTGDCIQGAYDSFNVYRCSECREDSLENGNYCPNCGAEMDD